MNIAIISGHLTRDPEIKVTPNGTSVCSFTVANTKKWKDGSGQPREDTIFLDVTAWGKTGETINRFFLKGDPIMVRGELKQDNWEDKQSGQKRRKIKLDCTFPHGGFDFMGKASGGGNQQSNQGYDPETNGNEGEQMENAPRYSAPPPRGQGQQQGNRQPPRNAQPPQDNVDDDVPF